MNNYDELYKIIDYRFNDEDLLRKALTHSSYAAENKIGYENNNERLEFIGDAYVDAVVGMKLFEIMGKAHEGTLSRRRADVVCEASLADTAIYMDLGDFLLLGRGEDSSGGRFKPSILSDASDACPFQPASTSRSRQKRQVLAVPSPSNRKESASL